jgi:CRISPR-associated protein Cas1
MQDQSTTPDPEFISSRWRESGEDWTHRTEEATKKGKTLVLSGHGVKLNVNRGTLIVQDGMTHSTHEPQTHTLYRGMHGIERIVIVSPTGSVTFDALRWCEQQKVIVEVIFEEDGDELASGLVSVGGRETTDIPLRRAQYEARFRGKEVKICRWLLAGKLQGQIKVLERVVRKNSKVIHKLKDFIEDVEWSYTIDNLRGYEAKASSEYYTALENIPVGWRDSDKKIVPEHWLTVGPRVTKLTHRGSGPRYASNPTNAIRNLAFTVLGNQIRIAAAVQGFDVACGWLHADNTYRDSLVYDLMEPYRPVIDEKVIGLVKSAKFTYGDFVTTKEGQVRLHPALAKFVVSTCVIPWTEIDLSPVVKLLMAPQ